MSNGKKCAVSFGTDSVWQLNDYPSVYYCTSNLAIDCDGHPQAYHPDGSPPGVDYLANAGSPGNWWGIATDSDDDPYV
jgi:hypothetical protein